MVTLNSFSLFESSSILEKNAHVGVCVSFDPNSLKQAVKHFFEDRK
jgi:hypothetical protein